WTHNDSGDSPRLFAFDTDGRHRGEVKIEGAEHVDWEDIASYDIGGVASLMIGDVGDNRLSRQSVTCYRIVEPQLTDDRAKVVQTWSIRYPEGSRDCEAIAVDGSQQLLVLATKSKGLQAELYGVKLDSDRKYQEATATFLGKVPIPFITGMDIHPHDHRIVFSTYLDAFLYQPARMRETATIDWSETLNSQPRLVPTPFRRQGEAVCFDRNLNGIWLTSEKKPTPLMFVPLE
ncbi:MAG: hypothetical protein R3C05_15315, partial [Pirellulaceae bacterium]